MSVDPEAGRRPTAASQQVVLARPLRTGLIANIAAVVTVLVFVAISLVMRTDSAGATFHLRDQIFTVVLGLIIAAGMRLPARPRLRADAETLRFRGYVGDYREIPWSVVQAVEFPSNVRFARIALGGEETLALYAVQRADRAAAVATMRGLRSLLAQAHDGHRQSSTDH